MAGAQGLARLLGNGVIALVIGAAAVYAHTFTMDADVLAAPLTSHAAVGAVATTGQFSARLDKVVIAKSLRLVTDRTDSGTGHRAIGDSTSVGTPDVFVVTTISATSPGDPTRLASVSLRTADGVEYNATDRVDQLYTHSNRPVQNGWWVDMDFVFEVPTKALPGASIIVSAPSSNGIYDSIYPNRYNQLLPEAALALTTGNAGARRLIDEVKPSWQLVAEE
jgi:hypothetical protein